jgi:hypothetical protein
MLIREVIRADIKFVSSFLELVKCFETRTKDASECVRPRISRREFTGVSKGLLQVIAKASALSNKAT